MIRISRNTNLFLVKDITLIKIRELNKKLQVFIKYSQKLKSINKKQLRKNGPVDVKHPMSNIARTVLAPLDLISCLAIIKLQYMAEENIKQFKEEVIRHFDVVAEKIEDKIQIVSEQVAANTEKLEEHDQRFDKLDQKFENVETTLETIKLDIEIIKNDLKQKVGRDEFVILERRVSMLEAKRN